MASSSASFAVQAKERLGAGRRKDEDGGVRKLPTPKSQLHGEADPHPHEGEVAPCGTINKPGASVGSSREEWAWSWVRVLLDEVVSGGLRSVPLSRMRGINMSMK